jgi:hypothetical protein
MLDNCEPCIHYRDWLCHVIVDKYGGDVSGVFSPAVDKGCSSGEARHEVAQWAGGEGANYVQVVGELPAPDTVTISYCADCAELRGRVERAVEALREVREELRLMHCEHFEFGLDHLRGGVLSALAAIDAILAATGDGTGESEGAS